MWWFTRTAFVSLSALLWSLSACPSQAPEARSPGVPVAPSAERPPATGEATLLLMADIRGVLRPCGCTVELQRGGFDRLGPYLDNERARYPDARLLHAGPAFFEDAIVADNKQAQRDRQIEVAADLLGRMGVDTAGATAVDAAAAGERLPALVERARLRITAANLELASGPGVSPWEVREIGGLRIGIFALADPSHRAALGGAGAVAEPVAAATRAVAALRGEADVLVLLSALGLRETNRLVRRVPGIHFAVVGGMADAPSVVEEAELVGETRVMQFHREGRYIGRLTVRVIEGRTDFVDASQVSEAELAELDERIARLEESLRRWAATEDASWREVRSAEHHLAALKTQRDARATRRAVPPPGKSSFSFTLTPLNWDLPQDPDILAIMDAFDEELARINVAAAGSLPEPKPGEAVYVGIDTCFGCHAETRHFWEQDRHAEAWDTLERLRKTFDAECISCHVTGYNQAGGSLVGQTAGRENVQCEACHGPGSIHSETGDPADIVLAPPVDVCTSCHNEHHSPTFVDATYRPKLLVPGHGLPLP